MKSKRLESHQLHTEWFMHGTILIKIAKQQIKWKRPSNCLANSDINMDRQQFCVYWKFICGSANSEKKTKTFSLINIDEHQVVEINTIRFECECRVMSFIISQNLIVFQLNCGFCLSIIHWIRYCVDMTNLVLILQNFSLEIDFAIFWIEMWII